MSQLNPIVNLHCACCGGYTKERQFFNQDAGYGLCPKCAVWIGEKEKKAYIERTYDAFGIHHSMEEKTT